MDEMKKEAGGTVERRKKAYGRTRPIYFIWPIISTLSICVTILFFGFGISVLVRESLIDGKWYRMALCALLPLQILFTQFVPQAAISCIMQIIGPIKQLETNSQYYSGMPVYTESLDGVLDPTIQSLQKAISTYESQGGTASIFVNEDGMQVIPEHQAELRRRYYADHNIGWVARPKHNHDGFIRKGRFKKASNMNFCLMISRNLELLLDANPDLDYDEALERVLEEDGRAWAAGDIQMGDLILIVDSDTRVPEDCLLDAASEFLESPEVAIIQHSASPMLVTFNFFEMGIAFFTKIIYASIRYCCASGETSPFVGHNAFLRWSAIKEVAFEEDSVTKYWSESHVSEDFDMSLRLQIKGYTIRYAAYCGDGFQEGVSLSVYDEVGRWQKYAYGCSELVFHPLKDMLCKGIFTPLFWRFLFSNMNLYYAIGAAWILTLLNYFLIGYWDDEVDMYYLPSFDVLVTTITVFTVLSNISFAIFRYRLKDKSIFGALWENICWMPFFAVFFSGLSFHVSLALVSHLIGYNMTWGTTAKELENSNFFKEVPKVLSGYKRMYVIFLLLTVMLPVMVYVPPVEWAISGVTLIVPAVLVFGGHLLLPIALNPSLMTFSF
ncbi:glycosyl transferase family group 2-domain-containing protein [Chytridium lagenaria]|nr:glycosyl transferase family group 2-domain-containing protein [Chytridium lagenaria]